MGLWSSYTTFSYHAMRLKHDKEHFELEQFSFKKSQITPSNTTQKEDVLISLRNTIKILV